ncbi:hypothetical protein SAY86_015986 [Trapa natans]|uniref:Uncharacterized protein n=1 Tax=Trapa natans TaxID=22666 RepID=A0AAN7LC74_TRANT|nr:hypothetical protein SAY86_015986 [Trapa natans]
MNTDDQHHHNHHHYYPLVEPSYGSATPPQAKRESSNGGGGLLGKSKYKLWVLAAILLLAFWSMFTGSVTLKWSAGNLSRLSDKLFHAPLYEDLDILEVEEREKVVRHMWEVYIHSSNRLPRFWSEAFQAAYESLAGDVPSVHDAAISEIAKLSLNPTFSSDASAAAANSSETRHPVQTLDDPADMEVRLNVTEEDVSKQIGLKSRHKPWNQTMDHGRVVNLSRLVSKILRDECLEHIVDIPYTLSGILNEAIFEGRKVGWCMFLTKLGNEEATLKAIW